MSELTFSAEQMLAQKDAQIVALKANEVIQKRNSAKQGQLAFNGLMSPYLNTNGTINGRAWFIANAEKPLNGEIVSTIGGENGIEYGYTGEAKDYPIKFVKVPTNASGEIILPTNENPLICSNAENKTFRFSSSSRFTQFVLAAFAEKLLVTDHGYTAILMPQTVTKANQTIPAHLRVSPAMTKMYEQHVKALIAPAIAPQVDELS